MRVGNYELGLYITGWPARGSFYLFRPMPHHEGVHTLQLPSVCSHHPSKRVVRCLKVCFLVVALAITVL